MVVSLVWSIPVHGTSRYISVSDFIEPHLAMGQVIININLHERTHLE